MRVELLDYELPEELIADRPPERRDGGRLLVMAPNGALEHRQILDLPDLLPEGALLVANDTRVIPARLFARKPTGGRVEVMLLEKISGGGRSERWKAFVRASKAIPLEMVIEGADLSCHVLSAVDADPGVYQIELTSPTLDVSRAVDSAGHMPLPPYMRRADEAADRERYQTVFAKHLGAVAAPTAGLHLTPELLRRIEQRGIEIARVTLHVSRGTFLPVRAEDLSDHPMHAEEFIVGDDVAEAVSRARSRGAPIVALGTTVVRALESAIDPERPRHVRATSGMTRLLLQPGDPIHIADRMLTNFHLPRSTLLALVGAFSGLDRIKAAYAEAITKRYRFYSYGDAMLLSRAGS